MENFDTMFGDGMNSERRGMQFCVIMKRDKLYEMRRAYTYIDAMVVCQSYVKHWAEITEASGWTVNEDGSLNDKLFTFFKPLKE